MISRDLADSICWTAADAKSRCPDRRTFNAFDLRQRLWHRGARSISESRLIIPFLAPEVTAHVVTGDGESRRDPDRPTRPWPIPVAMVAISSRPRS